MSETGTLDLRAPDGSDHRADVLLPRFLALAHLDAQYVDAPLPPGLALTFFNHGGAGFGDIAFAWKATRILTSHAPELRVTLVTTNEEKTRAFDFGDVPILPEERFAQDASARVRSPDLWLAAPTLYDGYEFEATDFARFPVGADVPYLFISEYGQIRYLRKVMEDGVSSLCDRAEDTCFDAFEATYGEGNVGFDTRDQSVLAFAPDGSHEKVGNFRQALAADSALRGLLTNPRLRMYPCGLEAGELGILIDDRLGADDGYATDRLDHKPLGTLIDEPDGALYYGYAHTGIDRFLAVITLLETDRTRRVDVVVPSRTAPRATIEAQITAPVLARLKAGGIGQLQVLSDEDSEHIELGDGKTMRLMTHYPLDNRDVHRLLRRSEAATMVSGDQSTSEALSARKWIAITEPYYCQTWVTDALLALADGWSGLRPVLDWGVDPNPGDERWAEMARAVADPELPERGIELANHIRAHHRANERIAGVVKRTLLEDRRPDLVRAERALLADAYDRYTVEHGIRLSRAGLRTLYEQIRSQK